MVWPATKARWPNYSNLPVPWPRQGYYNNFFRNIGEKRTIEKGGAGGSDCRMPIFR